MEGVKYVQNISSRLVQCDMGKDAENRKIIREFQPETRGGLDHHIVHTGFVRLTDDELRDLEAKSSAFRFGVKNRLLIIHDEPPAGALTPYDHIQEATAKVAKLSGDIKLLQDANATLEVKIKEQEVLLDARDSEIATLKSGMTSNKAVAPEAVAPEAKF